MVTLIIPEKTDPEFEQVFKTWTDHGGQIKRLGKYWIKDEELANQKIAIYGNQTFSLVLAQIYNVELISPDDSLIARFNKKWTKRIVLLQPISEISGELFPVFIKPVIPKLFMAGIFQHISDFKNATKDLPDSELTLVSNVIYDITAEARSFIMEGTIKDMALYEGLANLEEAKIFLTEFISANLATLPKVVVIDLGFSKQLGWFILELNACWGAGLNNCLAKKVMDCIIGATVPAKP